MNKFYLLETYGCQMNVAESSSVELELQSIGWQSTSDIQKASMVLINSCAVRNSAEDRVWGRLAYYNSFKKPHFKVVLLGCMAQRLGDKIKERAPIVEYVVGTFGKDSFLRLVRDNFYETTPLSFDSDLLISDNKKFHFSTQYATASSHSAFVPIMHGCNNFCTYCIVPYVRGREVSRPVSEIVSEIEKLVSAGVKEITLLGQNVNSYSYSDGEKTIDFPDLLSIICAKTKVSWLRFTSSHPKDLSDKLIDVMARESAVCKQIHLALQHGSDKILSAMNRKYTSGDYKNLVQKLRAKVENVGITTDLLIGFPGETEEDFEATLNFIKEIKFDDAFTYYYNKRSGTVAAKMENQLPLEVKKERLAKLIELQRSITLAQKKTLIGTKAVAIIEKKAPKDKSMWLARTNRNFMVVFNAPELKEGDFCEVKLLDVKGTVFIGEVLK